MDESQVGYNNWGWDANVLALALYVEGDPIDELSLFFRGEYRRRWHTRDDSQDKWVAGFLCAAGGTLRLPLGLRIHLAGVFVEGRVDDVINPVSVLAPRIMGEVPDRLYALFALNYTHELGGSRLDLGLSYFNPFGAPFREEMGTVAPDGSNFGGEVMGTRAMLTARFRY
jgi:hypothetical protein